MASSILEMSKIETERVQKLRTLTDAWILCFPERFDRAGKTIAEIRERTTDLMPSPIDQILEQPGTNVNVAGRITAIRRHGALMFIDVRDQSGTIQVTLNVNEPTRLLDGKGGSHESIEIDGKVLTPFDVVEQYFDRGDFIGAMGTAYKTKRSDPAVLGKSIQLLTKAVSPLPDKHHGLKDAETRFRKRYLDMLDPEVQARLVRRVKFFKSMRRYLEDSNFMEVDTPRLENTTGWADARPFQTHYNAFDTDVFLRICAGELWQKRLMVGGFERTFEIGPAFRNEGVSPEHAQDYMQMEVYWAYADYNDMMGLVKDLYLHVIRETYDGKTRFSIRGHEVDFGKDWEVLDYAKLIAEKTGIDIFQSSEEEMVSKLRQLGAKYEAGNRPRLVDYLWKHIRPTIAGPAFLVNEPKFTSPLAKSDPNDENLTHRFHVIIAGSEVGNGYSELNDPIDQLERFEQQQSLRDSGDEEAQMMDVGFVQALMHGMPPTSGFGVSERLFAFLEGESIRECQFFPYTRPE